MDLSIPSGRSPSRSSTKQSVSPWKYDVFLSFRGDDTRKGFVSHLYDELQDSRGIKTFKDDEGLEVGAPISPGLLKAIEESRFAIIVLSANYASSAWCLDELTYIFQCMEGKDTILPIFYHVDPSDVRHQRGSFEAAFTIHEERYKQDLEMVKQWRVALRGVANISGWTTNKFPSESKLVKQIVEVLSSKVVQVPVAIAINSIISVGPYGSNDAGEHFDDGVHSTIRQIVVRHYPKSMIGIAYFRIKYDTDDGNSRWADKHGSSWFAGKYGIPWWADVIPFSGYVLYTYLFIKETITLDYPDEFLTSIHGRYHKVWLTNTITCLTFKSNKKTYGPFGRDSLDIDGTEFSIEVPGWKIVGLHGRKHGGLSLPAIITGLGAHLKPL